MGKGSRRRDRGQPASSKEDTAARDAHYRDNPEMKEIHSMFSMPGRIDIDAAANDGNEMKVCELLGASANPNRPHYRTSWSPLACAAKQGHSFILQQLLDHRADPSWMVRVSPLAEAAGAGQLDCVRRLLNANAPVDWPGEDGFPPLYSACANAHIPCVKLLLSAKADADVRTQGLSLGLPPGSKPEQDKLEARQRRVFFHFAVHLQREGPTGARQAAAQGKSER